MRIARCSKQCAHWATYDFFFLYFIFLSSFASDSRVVFLSSSSSSSLSLSSSSRIHLYLSASVCARWVFLFLSVYLSVFSFYSPNYARKWNIARRCKKSNYEDLHNRTQHKLRVNETGQKTKLKNKRIENEIVNAKRCCTEREH